MTDYPPKPASWAKGLGKGSGDCPCGAWWTGHNTCHCPTCHRNFSNITAFDKHRVGSHANDTRHCVDPATVLVSRGARRGQPALVDAGREYPCWGFPSADSEWWKDAPGGDAA